MEFSFINILAMMYCSLLVIPEMIHTIRGVKKVYPGKPIVFILDYVLKYACIVLMFIPLGMNKFGFNSVAEMLIYVIGDAIIVLIYDVMFVINIRRDSFKVDNLLLYLSLAIFLLSGFVLKHYVLIIVTLAYGYLHSRVLKSLINQYDEK